MRGITLFSVGQLGSSKQLSVYILHQDGTEVGCGDSLCSTGEAYHSQSPARLLFRRSCVESVVSFGADGCASY